MSAPAVTPLSTAGPAREAWWRTAWMPAAIVGGLTLVGLAIRVANFDQSLLADELSTYWIIHDRGLRDVLDLVHSDAEITPPLYFALSWFTLKLGSAPEWARLPSLLAGTASIPLTYLLGARTVGRAAGAFAAALMALSPFMIYYSDEARAYALMIFLLLLSTLALLAATESGRPGWWVLYAACTCGAMITHYTAIFYLVTQFLWALWARPRARRGLLIASAVAAAAFLPWLSGFIADNNSPTTAILNALQPFTYDAVRFSIEAWAVGYPYVGLSSVPGDAAVALELAGLAVAGLGAVLALRRHRSRLRLGGWGRKVRPELALVVALALATPLGEIVGSAIGTNLISARNLNASLPALLVCAGALVTAAGPLAGTVSAALLLAGFSVGAARTLESRYARPDYSGVAALIEREARPGDVVVDGAALTPVPTTPLDVYLPPGHREFRLDLPVSDKPFTVFDRVPDARRLTDRAFRLARGHRVFLVRVAQTGPLAETPVTARLRRTGAYVRHIVKDPPRGFDVIPTATFPGLPPLTVTVFDGRAAGR